ncbi:MAG: ArsR/SmtB family transcription factor [Patescibacteria group bacterium]
MLTGGRLKEKVKPFAKNLRAIAHPYRLAILYLLSHEPMWVRDLVLYLNLPENLIAHHLKIMHLAGWVLKTREGKNVSYRLNEKAFFELNRLLDGTPFSRQTLSKYFR